MIKKIFNGDCDVFILEEEKESEMQVMRHSKQINIQKLSVSILAGSRLKEMFFFQALDLQLLTIDTEAEQTSQLKI